MQGTNHGTASPCSRTGAPRPARLGGDASALQWTLCSRTGCKTVCAGEGGMIGEGPSPKCRRDGDCQGHRHPIHRHVAVEFLQGAAAHMLVISPARSSSSSEAGTERAVPVHHHAVILVASVSCQRRARTLYCVDAEASGMARCTITPSFRRPMTPATPPLPLSPSGGPRVGSRSMSPSPKPGNRRCQSRTMEGDQEPASQR